MRTFRLLLLDFCISLLPACSTQYRKSPDGSLTINNNFLSKGTQNIGADGSIYQDGSAEVAAKELGNYGRILSNATLVKAGIDATKSIGNNAVDAIK